MSRLMARRSVSTTREMPAYCTFTATSASVTGAGAMHLRQRGRGDRLAGEFGEQFLGWGAQLAVNLCGHLLVGAWRHGVLQTAEDGDQLGGATSARLLRNWHDLISSPCM